jgi:hypothetical protein
MLANLDNTAVGDGEVLFVQTLGVRLDFKVVRPELTRLDLHPVAVQEFNRHALTVLGEESNGLHSSLNTVKHVPDGSSLLDEVGFLKFGELVVLQIFSRRNELFKL